MKKYKYIPKSRAYKSKKSRIRFNDTAKRIGADLRMKI